MTTYAEILKKAKARVAPPSQWVQDCLAVDDEWKGQAK